MQIACPSFSVHLNNSTKFTKVSPEIGLFQPLIGQTLPTQKLSHCSSGNVSLCSETFRSEMVGWGTKYRNISTYPLEYGLRSKTCTS